MNAAFKIIISIIIFALAIFLGNLLIKQFNTTGKFKQKKEKTLEKGIDKEEGKIETKPVETSSSEPKTEIMKQLPGKKIQSDIFLESLRNSGFPAKLLEHISLFYDFESSEYNFMIYDKSGNNLNGVAFRCEKTPEGLINKAIKYNGKKSFIKIKNLDGKNNDDKNFVTISFWWKMDRKNESDKDKIVIFLRLFSASDFIYAITLKNSEAFGKWHHFVLVSDQESKKRLYCDGELLKEVEIAEEKGSNINKVANENKHYFYGTIDEIIIFDLPLNEFEIKALYNFYNTKYLLPKEKTEKKEYTDTDLLKYLDP